MKPVSIIFLIVSALLIVVGLITAGVAGGIARAEGFSLVQAKGEDSAFRYEYADDNIGKISLGIKNAEVNIIGGADKGCIELINFPEGMYEFSAANRTITVRNNSELFSVSGIASFVGSFRGLGGIVNYFNLAGTDRVVNIYISAETPITVVDCTLSEGDVNIENCDILADYNVSVDEGNITAKNLSTRSSLNVTLGEGSLTAAHCNMKQLTVKISEGSASLSGSFDSVKAEIGTGDFSCQLSGDISLTNYQLATNVGRVVIDGANFGGTAEKNDETVVSLIDVGVGMGDISLTSGGRAKD